jgi:putative NADH-flavin reductase
MKMTVLGASGKTGQDIVNQALEAGHTVSGLVRRHDALAAQLNLNVFEGDVTNPQDIAKASNGTDVIVSALGSRGGSLMTDTVTAVIAASKVTHVKRFILMSSFVVRKEQLRDGFKFVTGIFMSKAIQDKSKSEELLRKSDLEWTIVYPTLLTDTAKGASVGASVRVVGSPEKVGMKNKIARADVAAWMLSEAENNAYVRKEALISA